VNQLGAKFVFESGDLFAHRWLAGPAFLRHGGKAPLLDYPNEHFHRV
jgi:hypothetical protein